MEGVWQVPCSVGAVGAPAWLAAYLGCGLGDGQGLQEFLWTTDKRSQSAFGGSQEGSGGASVTKQVLSGSSIPSPGGVGHRGGGRNWEMGAENLLLFGKGQDKVTHSDLEWTLLGMWRPRCQRDPPQPHIPHATSDFY